jgi:hypothetical protein
MPNYNIYIPNAYEEKLKSLAQNDESIGQCAKRLLLTLLDSDRPAPPPALAPDELEELRDRIGAIEKKLADLEDDRPAPPRSSPAIGPGDREKFVICEVIDGRPVRYWGGEDWTSHLSAANRYQSESSLRRTLDKLAKRKRENPEISIRFNTIGAIERILGGLE